MALANDKVQISQGTEFLANGGVVENTLLHKFARSRKSNSWEDEVDMNDV